MDMRHLISTSGIPRIFQHFGRQKRAHGGFKITLSYRRLGSDFVTQWKMKTVKTGNVKFIMSYRFNLWFPMTCNAENQDPCCNLAKTIPVRLYGDGAESQRLLLATRQKHVSDLKLVSPLICHGIPGKQKFELLLLQFPMCPSSSTFDNRIMQPSCKNKEFAVATSNISIQSSPHCCAAAHGTPRLSVINTNYSKDEARAKCLEAVAWSLNCLSALDDY